MSLALAVVVLGSGCRQSSAIRNPQFAIRNPAAFPLTVRDDLGREVTFKSPPQRIVTLQPSATETVFALGLGDRVVGVTDYCDYPPEARTKEKLGLPMSPNLERLVVLRPDLVLVPFGVPQEVLDRLTELRVAYLGLNPHTLADALSWMRRIGQVAGIAVHAETVVGRLEARVAAVTEKTAGLTEKEKPTVLLVFWTDPLMSFGPDTFGDDLLRLAGGCNFTGKATQPYPVVSWEVVVRCDPDVILLTGHTGEEQPSLEQEPGWTQLKAVRTSQVHTFSDGDLITVPGPRLVDGLEQMARWLHPELCGRKGREGEGGGMQEKVGK